MSLWTSLWTGRVFRCGSRIQLGSAGGSCVQTTHTDGAVCTRWPSWCSWFSSFCSSSSSSESAGLELQAGCVSRSRCCWFARRKEKKAEDLSKVESTREEINTELEEHVRLKVKKVRKHKKGYKVCHSEDWKAQTEASTVIAPVFTAALACLEVALQEGKGQGVALVYFQGLCHSRDIPKALRGVRRYCLSRDFRGLVQELGGTRSPCRSGDVRCWPRLLSCWPRLLSCWPRLLSKVLSMWLARRLAHRLQALLPPHDG